MFQFPTFASLTYVFSQWWPCGRVSPFRHPRINAYSQLPAAFRSVSRLSSPLIAKASTKCPYLSLDSYNINILLFISHSTKNLFLPVLFLQKNFVSVYFYTFFLDFLIIQYVFISYYSAFSLFTMFYSIQKQEDFLVEVRRLSLADARDIFTWLQLRLRSSFAKLDSELHQNFSSPSLNQNFNGQTALNFWWR